MRVAAVLLGLYFYASMGRAEPHEARVEICMDAWQAGDAGWQAKHIASEVYRKIDVKLIWKAPHSCGKQAIRVNFERHVPDKLPPGTLALSWPFQRQRRMAVYWSRIQDRYSPRMRPTILGYTLAHEIGHILMEGDWHAEEGVMKAHWSTQDLAEMLHGALGFAEPDRQAIVRSISCLSPASAPNPCAPR